MLMDIRTQYWDDVSALILNHRFKTVLLKFSKGFFKENWRFIFKFHKEYLRIAKTHYKVRIRETSIVLQQFITSMGKNEIRSLIHIKQMNQLQVLKT